MTTAPAWSVPAIAPRRALTDEVYDTVLALLLSGDLAPGDRLSIDALARALGVSATPLREALVRLAGEGLVVKTPRKGYAAAPLLDETGFRNLSDIRLILEPAAARLATGNVSEDILQRLAESIEEMTDIVTSAPVPRDRVVQYRAFADADAFFHHQIAVSSQNPLLAEAVERLRSHNHLYRLYYSHGIADQTSQEHRAVLDALFARRPVDAETAMRAHVEASRTRIMAHFDS